MSKSKWRPAFLAEIKQDGVKTVYADPKNIAGSKMDALWTTKEAKYVIIKNNALLKQVCLPDAQSVSSLHLALLFRLPLSLSLLLS